jgi:LL-diaminopimelate aminotransferase
MSYLAPHFFAALSARLASLQKEGRDIIRLDEGSPDLPPPPEALQALAEAAQSPENHAYQPHRGPAALRQAWCAAYHRLHGVTLDPDTEIIPLLGSKEGIFHLSLALLDPGDVVLAPDPGYITYTRGAQMAGAEIVTLPLSAANDWQPDLDAIPAEVLRRTRLLWLNYPNNPTAAVAHPETLRRAVELAAQYGFWLCHDAAYMQVTFEGYQAPSLLSLPGAKEVGVEFNSLSKSHNLAGWRSAALLGNPQVVKALYTLKTNADSGHFYPIWAGSTAALNGDPAWVAQRNLVYQARRDALVDGLIRIGWPVERPRASLYVWAPIPVPLDDIAFATRLLEEAGVSLTPGSVFGPAGKGYVRISITAPEQRIRQAVERLQDWFAHFPAMQANA